LGDLFKKQITMGIIISNDNGEIRVIDKKDKKDWGFCKQCKKPLNKNTVSGICKVCNKKNENNKIY